MSASDSPQSPVSISDEARSRILAARSGQEGAAEYALWMEVTGSAHGEYTYELYLHGLEHAGPDDVVLHHDDLSIVIPGESAPKLAGASIGFAQGPSGEGWVIDNPNKPGPLLNIGRGPTMGAPGMGAPGAAAATAGPGGGSAAPQGDVSGEVAQRVIRVLEGDINPMIAAHGGRADLVSVDGSTAYLRLSGGCQGCGMATVTLSQGIEVALKEAIPEIEEVVDVTDHAAGTNPYFEPSKK